MRRAIIAAFGLFLFTLPVQAGDAEKGAKVYRKCVSCHMIGDGAKNRVGPQLNGIIGREIGAVADYKYSKAMVKYAAAEKLWSEETSPLIWKARAKSLKAAAWHLPACAKKKTAMTSLPILKKRQNKPI